MSLYSKKNFWVNYFKPTSDRLAKTGLCTALSILFSLFSFITNLFPIDGFLVIEVNWFIYLLLTLKINLFYTFICVTASSWMRLLYISHDPIGVLGLWLSDFIQIMLVSMLLLIFLKSKTNREKEFVLLNLQSKLLFVIAYLIPSLACAIIMCLVNYFVILDAYGALNLKNSNTYFLILIAYMIGKYYINLMIFLLVEKTLKYI